MAAGAVPDIMTPYFSGEEKAMPVIEDNGFRIEVNEEGFMVRIDEWSKDIAGILARKGEGIEALTAEHWSVIDFIRGHYFENGQAPTVRKLCKATGLPLKRIYELFPSGPAKGGCMIAGIPKPEGCV